MDIYLVVIPEVLVKCKHLYSLLQVMSYKSEELICRMP
jgi:hypothetical protein